MGVNSSIEGSNPSFSAVAVASAFAEGEERWASGSEPLTRSRGGEIAAVRHRGPFRYEKHGLNGPNISDI
jgi:hypothetical protein